ncbi:MAG TPA: acyl-CoA dehydrogenase family protein [Deltaproteobacteria bacterium]|nr:acyl-CoA dehydrogenase family protein [Deltaproteobacteria bacterium]
MYLLHNEDQKMFVEQLRRMVDEKVAPRAAEIDEKEEFPWDLKQIFQDMGLLGLSVPEQYGGTDQGHMYTCLAVEEIARACVSSSLIVQGQSLGWEPILIGGSEEQKKKYGPMVASGEVIISYGLTEPGAGSDASAMATRAVKKGDTYIINGSKCFITNGPVADLITLFAMTDASQGVKGISAFIVPTSSPGFSVAKKEKKMGIKGSPTGELVFEDVEIPAENLVGVEGKGFIYAMKTLDTSRPVIAAQACGVAKGALELAIKYAKERVQFGRPIGNFQGIGWMLADMASQVDAARSLVYQSALLIDENDRNKSYLSAASKLVASDIAMKVTTDALQIAGGYGYMREYPFERMMRDAKITQIYEGTNQIMKLVISRELLK